jgi:hypothetical protein
MNGLGHQRKVWQNPGMIWKRGKPMYTIKPEFQKFREVNLVELIGATGVYVIWDALQNIFHELFSSPAPFVNYALRRRLR